MSATSGQQARVLSSDGNWPLVTALRPAGRGQTEVAIELDGARWRVVPLEAVYRADLSVGRRLDRSQARALRAEIRRQSALRLALGSIRYRDHTVAALDERLERRGVVAAERRQALDTLERAGLVDDRRFANGRAALLAGRGYGDLLITADLARHGVDPEHVAEVIALLEPEALRASALVDRHGLAPKTLRRLRTKGFTEASLEAFVAELVDDA